MTEHEHTPPIPRDAAQWLCPGKITIVVDGQRFVRTWDEARHLAAEIIASLEMEYRP
jgi:hypothetical protein